ncbi:MAG: 50S ribosome-binding GTPase [Saprospiraceae bacterium]|nr:50S ribosome-binding GTPase [Saprospiraceae bacterium]
MSGQLYKVGLVGNPNSGKTSIFNLLTGLNQKVGNYPGLRWIPNLVNFMLMTDL